MEQQQSQSQSTSFMQLLPRSPEDIPRVFSWFEQMRTHHPVFHGEPQPVWHVFRYDDVKEALTDYSRFSSQPLPGFSIPATEDTLVSKDPPDHRKLRNLVNLAFTPRAVAHLSGRIEKITQDLLNQVRSQGKMDVVSDIAFPLPAKVIAEMLAAGQETTKNLIANAILCFTDHPDTLERLRREPALMPDAIEEVLRYLPPVWFIVRRTMTEVELGGQLIPANQAILTWLASAARDPAQFANPDQFIIDREPNRHITFGHGIHFCIGAPLARLEAKIALPMMVEQLKDLRRVEGVPIGISTGIVFVIENLPVTFQPF